MIDLESLFLALGVVCGIGLVAWPVSILKKNVGFVDSLWPLFFIACALVYYTRIEASSVKSDVVLVLVLIWGIRLSGHITWRNWGEAEDHRYQAIRRNNEPFWIKSLYIVFLLQAVLAWLVSVPLLGAMHGGGELDGLGICGIVLFALGFFFEAVGDFQLAQFKANPSNRGKVLQSGLWRYTRHPNYFGDFCVWWGFYGLALSAGAWWSLPAPLIMSFLLLRVSGVRLLEKDIGERRPDYADYIRRTPAFVPWFPKV